LRNSWALVAGIVLTAWNAPSRADVVYTSQAAFLAATKTDKLVNIGFGGIAPNGSFVNFSNNAASPGYTDAATGVNFNVPFSPPGAPVNVTSKNYYGPNSFPNDFLTPGYLPNTTSTDIVITIPKPGTQAIGLTYSSFESIPFTFTLSDGTTVNETPPAAPTFGFVGFVTSVPITSLTVHAGASGGGGPQSIFLDSVIFAAVPEPSPLALGGLVAVASAGVCAARHRYAAFRRRVA
jgi:hypothetical protein